MFLKIGDNFKNTLVFCLKFKTYENRDNILRVFLLDKFSLFFKILDSRILNKLRQKKENCWNIFILNNKKNK